MTNLEAAVLIFCALSTAGLAWSFIDARKRKRRAAGRRETQDSHQPDGAP